MPSWAPSAALSCFILSWNLHACHWWIKLTDHSPSQSATHQNSDVLQICGLRKVLSATFLSILRIPHLFRSKHTWILQTLPMFFVLTLRRLQLGNLIFVIILRLIRRSHCAMSVACSRCVLVHVLHTNYVIQVNYGLCWRQNIPVTLRWENWNSERMGKARSAQLKAGNSQTQNHSKCLGSHRILSPAPGPCVRGG